MERSNLFLDGLGVQARRIAARAGRFRLLAWLGRGPYRLAARAVGQSLNLPGIAAIYARNSFARGDWVPGMSDIDLTAVLQANLGSERELALVDELHSRLASLKRWFAMLGELEILREDHFHLRTSFTVTGFESHGWKRLAGNVPLTCGYSSDADRLCRDRLNHAVQIFFHSLLPAFFRLQDNQYNKELSRLVLWRLARKLLRQIAPAGCSAKGFKLRSFEPPFLVATVIQRLSSAVRAESRRSEGGRPVDLTRLLNDDSLNRVRLQPLPPSWGRLRAHCESVFSSTIAPRKLYIVFSDGVTTECMAKCLEETRRGETSIAYCDRHILSHYLRRIDPLEHLTLLLERVVLLGKDPLPLPDGWLERDLDCGVRDYITDMLSHPYELSFRRCSSAEFRNLLFGWFLRTLRFLEEGVMTFGFDELAEWCKKRHRNYQVERFLEGVETTAYLRFVVLRRVVNDIARLVCIKEEREKEKELSRQAQVTAALR